MGILRMFAQRHLTSGDDILKGFSNLRIPLEELADDPLWNLSSENVLFFGHQTPIRQLLDYCGYKPISDSIDTVLGKWQVLGNESHTIGIYTGRLPKTWEGEQECETARFIVYAPADIDRKGFIGDLGMITQKSLEMMDFHTATVAAIAGLCLASLAGMGISAIANVSNEYYPWIVLPSMLAGAVAGIIWGGGDRLGFGAHLSSSAGNYKYGRQALNSLKLEAFDKVIQTKLVPARELNIQTARSINSISEAQPAQLVYLDAVPITPFKPASSTITEHGTICGNLEGAVNGHFRGLFCGIFSGDLEAQMQGDYAGKGEIGSITDTSPIDYLMQDSRGRRFRIGVVNYSSLLSYLLQQLSKTELNNEDGYLRVVREHLSKLSLDRATLFYSDVLSTCQSKIAERSPLGIYAWVISKGELPLLQLVGFKYSDGNTVMLQGYATHPILEDMARELRSITKGQEELLLAHTRALPKSTE